MLEQIARDARRLDQSVEVFTSKFAANERFNHEIGSHCGALWSAITAAAHVLPRLASRSSAAAEQARETMRTAQEWPINSLAAMARSI